MKRLSMRKIREALRLSFEGLTGRQIATSLGVSRSTIQNYLLRAQTEGLTWPRAKSMRDSDVERVLFA